MFAFSFGVFGFVLYLSISHQYTKKEFWLIQIESHNLDRDGNPIFFLRADATFKQVCFHTFLECSPLS